MLAHSGSEKWHCAIETAAAHLLPDTPAAAAACGTQQTRPSPVPAPAPHPAQSAAAPSIAAVQQYRCLYSHHPDTPTHLPNVALTSAVSFTSAAAPVTVSFTFCAASLHGGQGARCGWGGWVGG